MPIYEYKCSQCGHEFEELLLNSEEHPKCPQCQSSETIKKMSASMLKNKKGGDAPSCAPASGFS